MDCLHDGHRLPTDEEPPCPNCEGTGLIDSGWRDPRWNPILPTKCPICDGTGFQKLSDSEDDEIPY